MLVGREYSLTEDKEVGRGGARRTRTGHVHSPRKDQLKKKKNPSMPVKME